MKRLVQHIYIYSWENEAIRPLWMASDIGMDVQSFTFDERAMAADYRNKRPQNRLGLDQLGTDTYSNVQLGFVLV